MPPSQAHNAVEVLSLGANEILRRVSKKAFGGEAEVDRDIQERGRYSHIGRGACFWRFTGKG